MLCLCFLFVLFCFVSVIKLYCFKNDALPRFITKAQKTCPRVNGTDLCDCSRTTHGEEITSLPCSESSIGWQYDDVLTFKLAALVCKRLHGLEPDDCRLMTSDSSCRRLHSDEVDTCMVLPSQTRVGDHMTGDVDTAISLSPWLTPQTRFDHSLTVAGRSVHPLEQFTDPTPFRHGTWHI